MVTGLSFLMDKSQPVDGVKGKRIIKVTLWGS